MEYSDTEAVVYLILQIAAAVIIILSVACYVTLRRSINPARISPVQRFLEIVFRNALFIRVQLFFEEKIRDGLFTKVPEHFNDFIRGRDFSISKSYGHGHFKKIFREGYPKSAYLLIFSALFFVFAGMNPEADSKIPAAVVVAGALTVFISWLVSRIEEWIPPAYDNVFLNYVRYHALHLVSTSIIILLCLVAWFYLGERHIHIPVIIALLVLDLIGILVLCLAFKNPKGFNQFGEKLLETDLVKDGREPEGTWASVFYGMFSGPVYHFLKLLLLPAWVIVWLPTFLMETWIICIIVGFSWFFLAICTSHRNLQFVLTVIDRWFLTGGQFVVSLLIIVMALARVFKISYISTLLDGAPIPHILFFMGASYSALLLYEFWSNSILCHHLIYYLRPEKNPKKEFLSRIPYIWKGKNYCLQLYSGARFAVVEWNRKCGEDGTYTKGKDWLSIYEKREIFKQIAGQNKDVDENHYHELSKRVFLYFTVQNILLLGLAIIAVFWVLAQEPVTILSAQKISAQNVSTKNSDFQSVDLKELVMQRSKKDPAIFVAASGGGTRAAIYTTAVLAGLQEQKQLKNVVLASGVSGGGMSLAYFAANRNYLITDDPADCSKRERDKDPNAWCDYLDVVADNHIRYVASHIGNTDIYTDTSLGKYLADSFSRTFSIHHRRVSEHKADRAQEYITDLDRQTDVGVIMNTALVGHPYTDSNMLMDTLSSFEKKQRNKHEGELFYKINAGGRVIFTNLKDVDEFPGNKPDDHIADAGDVKFKYLIGGGKDIPLSTVGALTANFPPIFPNAIVKLGDDRYRVSDGGAVENRGLVSLLYAMRSMLQGMEPPELKQLPDMHIVMAEASGESIDYENYMTGLTAKSNSSVMIANQLILELKGILENKCGKDCNKLRIHYLNMPLMMRARGGLGTHWKMPSSITVSIPSGKEELPDVERNLNGAEFICLMQQLFTSNISMRSSPRISKNLSSRSSHEKCETPTDPLVQAAFLDDRAAVRKTWLSLVRELGGQGNVADSRSR